MRFVIYGAGAIGGTIGGRLFEAGEDVTLVARGPHAEALQSGGLRLVTPGGTATLRVPTVDGPARARLRDGDVVVLAMKSQGTLDAVRTLATVAPPGIRVVCAQNGLENERVALRSFADVYAMNVMCPATHLEPGVVVAHGAPASGILDLGRYPSGTDEVAQGVAAALSGASFASEARPDIIRWKAAKLLLNLTNAVEAVCGARPSTGAENDADRHAVAELVHRARAEGEACLRAAGIDIVSRDEERARRGDLLSTPPIAGGPANRSSTWQSLAKKAGSVETDYLTGEVVLLGRLHGVPTPTNTLLQQLATRMAVENEPPGKVPAAEVLARLRS